MEDKNLIKLGAAAIVFSLFSGFFIPGIVLSSPGFLGIYAILLAISYRKVYKEDDVLDRTDKLILYAIISLSLIPVNLGGTLL